MRENLIKQTYSVFVETASGRRKWHLSMCSASSLPSAELSCNTVLVAYFTQDTVDFLRTVDDLPHLASVRVPPGMYKSARSANRTGRTRSSDQPYLYGSSTVNRSQPHNVVVTATGIFCNPTSPRRVQEMLAPLEYLENVPPLRRHPIDEKALMSFVPGLS
jgi:hypothetical protein